MAIVVAGVKRSRKETVTIVEIPAEENDSSSRIATATKTGATVDAAAE